MTDGEDFLSRLQKDVESSLLVTEEANQRLRKSGEEALASIISLVDSGIRVGDNASMILFTLDVHPAQGEAFRTDTQNAISDTCDSCGASQIVEEGQLVCIYCRAPLPK